LRLHRIVYATDFMPAAVAALPHAARLAKASGAVLYLAHVIEGHAWETSPELLFQNRIGATRLLDQTRGSPELQGVDVSTVLRHGGVAAQVLDIAQECSADLIVTGTRAPHGVDRLFGSSVSGQLARSTPCPLLTVGPRARPAGEAKRLRNIVLATGLNPGAAAGISYARAFAQAQGAKLWVAHPLRQQALSDVVAAQRWLRKLVPEASGDELVFEVGTVEQVTLMLAHRESADLVMLAPGLGSLLPEIVRHVECPVMAVRYATPMIRPKSFGAEPALSK
jgi:nucleotide-binding universal stress UspA family protein